MWYNIAIIMFYSQEKQDLKNVDVSWVGILMYFNFYQFILSTLSTYSPRFIMRKIVHPLRPTPKKLPQSNYIFVKCNTYYYYFSFCFRSFCELWQLPFISFMFANCARAFLFGVNRKTANASFNNI